MTQLVHDDICAAGLTGGKRASCHVLRHTMATDSVSEVESAIGRDVAFEEEGLAGRE